MTHRRADEIDRGHRHESADEGKKLNGKNADGEIDADHGSERSAGGCAEDVGRHQRIAEQSLKGGAGNRERGADQQAASTRGPRTCRITLSTADETSALWPAILA